MALLRVDAVIFRGARSFREAEDELLPPNGRKAIPSSMGAGELPPSTISIDESEAENTATNRPRNKTISTNSINSSY